MGILDYIDWRGDLSFSVSPLNEVDNLIFSELAYVEMESIVSQAIMSGMDLTELYDQFCEREVDQSKMLNDPTPLLKKAAASERFGRVRLGGYVNEIDQDKQIQFAAVTFFLDDGTVFVAFRGTDNTIVGWREDFNISYLSETPGQSQAAAYLNRVIGEVSEDAPIVVGGHSKGGNFAVYASAFCGGAAEKKRICKVYSNDGPGFNEEVVKSDNYLSILDKVEKLLPDSSLVGILLSGNEKRRVVQSEARGIMQHDPYTWCVRGTSFLSADEMSSSSIFMDETLTRWISGLSNRQRYVLVSAIFDALDASGAVTLNDLNENKWLSFNAVAKAVRSMDQGLQRDVTGILKKLADTSREVFWDEAQKSFERRKAQNNKILL